MGVGGITTRSTMGKLIHKVVGTLGENMPAAKSEMSADE
jgi:hypothetical protein